MASSMASLACPPRILVSRTDRIGDVVLTLPLCGLLKAELGATVIALGRRYTRPVLEACDAVDEVLEWDDAAPGGARRALLASARADTILHVFPRRAIAVDAWRSRIPTRVGTSRRAYHWLTCNRLERLSRRGSALHEAQLDVQLARGLLPRVDHTLAELAPYGRLVPRVPVPADVAPLLAPDRFTLVVHPRSLGSGREWPLAAWSALVAALPAARFRVLVTGSRDEGAALAPWLATLPAHAHDVTGRVSLPELVALLAAADGVIAAGTGPLHVAAAAGARALGLFPPVRPIHP
ncbi:MAG TPA: glycosyltransferase family 9 protein, partial [Gemmatirosa sp.]|nr:glycosyltransferase family 9 protein [Gemmatirosa sp.]